MRIAADGYIDLGDFQRVRTPGRHDERHEPMPLGEGLAFLFSHNFAGHRVMVRGPSLNELSHLQHAVWANSIGQRMDLVDRLWRSLTEAVTPPHGLSEPHLLQVVQFAESWAYPIYLDPSGTSVAPSGGDPLCETSMPGGCPVLHLSEPHTTVNTRQETYPTTGATHQVERAPTYASAQR